MPRKQQLPLGVMTGRDFSEWLIRCRYSKTGAAAALGISRASIYSLLAAAFIPRAIALATIPLEAQRREQIKEFERASKSSGASASNLRRSGHGGQDGNTCPPGP